MKKGAARNAVQFLVATISAAAIGACELFTGPAAAPTYVGPTAVAGGYSFVSIVAGEGHTCGLTFAGVAYCWGANSTPRYPSDIPTGQLGDSTAQYRLTPVAVVGGHTFNALTAGGYHSCGLTTTGAAFCWGANRNETQANSPLTGQLGDGTPQNSSVPVAVYGGLTFTSISAGWYHTCGLTSGGQAYCWGASGLGVGDTAARFVPAATSGGLAFNKISAGGNHTCALTSAGQAYCWGANYAGQIGDSTTFSRLTPMPVSGGRTFQSIVVGGATTCGISSGAVYCWGDNALGAVGDGSTAARGVPTLTITTETLSGISIGSLPASAFLGSSHVCALTSAGKARCWGNNNAGQLGTGSVIASTLPASVTTALTFTSLASGGLHTCGLAIGGVPYCWGTRQAVGSR